MEDEEGATISTEVALACTPELDEGLYELSGDISMIVLGCVCDRVIRVQVHTTRQILLRSTSDHLTFVYTHDR